MPESRTDRRFVHINLGHGETLLGKLAEEVARQVLRGGAEGHHRQREPLLTQAIKGFGHERALLYHERVVEFLGKVTQRVLEVREVDDHVLMRALGLQVGLLEIRHHAPAMTVQVLALAVVIGQEMRSVEAALRFQPIHSKSPSIKR